MVNILIFCISATLQFSYIYLGQHLEIFDLDTKKKVLAEGFV